ncbi:hypothetical protein [Rufibacter immobilis]|uniref:hypothetical protein n=1 Tax=Rufibacter immobilis TaxID=1348778 RepID=UPI0035E867FB
MTKNLAFEEGGEETGTDAHRKAVEGAEPKDFFRQKRTAAEIKEEILTRFFPLWAEEVLAGQAGAQEPAAIYTDLNAAAGAPAVQKILRNIYASIGSRHNLNAAFQSFWGDGNKPALAQLQQTIQALPYYQELTQPPVFLHNAESKGTFDAALQQELPTLAVLDPFSYRYVQETFLQALESKNVHLFLLFEGSKMKALAKKASADDFAQRLFGAQWPAVQGFGARSASSHKKEEFLLGSLQSAIRERGFRVLQFRFYLPGKDQPHQYLLFVSRSESACTKLKEILLDYSDLQEDGVPLMSVNQKPLRLLVPEYAQYLQYSLHKLPQELLEKAKAYNRLSLEKIYEKHNVETNYSKANYLAALMKLKEQGKILLLNPKTGQQVHKLSVQCLIKFNP